MKFLVNGSLFTIEEVDGPIRRNGKDFAVCVRYAERTIRLLRTLPEEAKRDVLAAAISEACRRHRIPLVWPNWTA